VAELVLGATLSGVSWLIALLIFRCFLGLIANSYYLEKVRTLLAAARKESLDATAHIERLKAVGGASEGAVVAGITVNLILSVASIVLRASHGVA
jgi:hypothetical protein